MHNPNMIQAFLHRETEYAGVIFIESQGVRPATH